MVSQRKLKSVNSGNSETRHSGNSETLVRRRMEKTARAWRPFQRVRSCGRSLSTTAGG